MSGRMFHRAAQAAGALAALLGLIAFLGWVLDVSIMRCFVPGRSDVKFNTTLGLMGLGVALILAATKSGPRRRALSRALAIFAVVLGGATLAQYLFAIDIGIDELFWKDYPGAIGTTQPGRMSPQTTVTFICIGAALLCLKVETKGGHRPAQWLALAGAMFPLQLLIHHFYGGNIVLGLGAAQYSLMAIPTVIALLSLSAGTLFITPNSGWMLLLTSRSFAGASLRRMLFVGVTFPTLIGAVILFLLGGQRHTPSFAISAFAMLTTLAFCALVARHTSRLHSAEAQRARAEAGRARALTELQGAHELLNSHAQRLETQVQQRTAALIEANQQLETFAFSIAHDLRAPIRAQLGFASVLQRDYGEKLDPECRQAVRRIHDSAAKLQRMVEDLLGYARIGRGDWRIEAVPLRPLLEHIRADIAPEIQAAGGTVAVEADDVAAAAHGTTLSLCVANLVSNAAKFTRPGVPGQVRLRADALDGLVRIFVRDNGIGIAPGEQERIFAPFQRLHRASEYPGTGIGLALVRRGIERMGGRVTVESKLGEGSTFCIELPRAQSHRPTPAEPAREGELVGPPPSAV